MMGRKDLAAAQFTDVNGAPGGTSQYGYKLLANYNDLWALVKINSIQNQYSKLYIQVKVIQIGDGGVKKK